MSVDWLVSRDAHLLEERNYGLGAFLAHPSANALEFVDVVLKLLGFLLEELVLGGSGHQVDDFSLLELLSDILLLGLDPEIIVIVGWLGLGLLDFLLFVARHCNRTLREFLGCLDNLRWLFTFFWNLAGLVCRQVFALVLAIFIGRVPIYVLVVLVLAALLQLEVVAVAHLSLLIMKCILRNNYK